MRFPAGFSRPSKAPVAAATSNLTTPFVTLTPDNGMPLAPWSTLSSVPLSVPSAAFETWKTRRSLMPAVTVNAPDHCPSMLPCDWAARRGVAVPARMSVHSTYAVTPDLVDCILRLQVFIEGLLRDSAGWVPASGRG